MDTTPDQEPLRRPAAVKWAFAAALLALGIFIVSTVLQFFQTFATVPPIAVQTFKKTGGEPDAGEVLQFILAYRIGMLGWLILFSGLYLAVSFSFRRGSRKARSAAAVLALISAVGLFLPGTLNPLWVFLNNASAALLFTRPSRLFYTSQTHRKLRQAVQHSPQ